MIRKRGIIATVIYISILVNAIPLASSLFDIYNEPLDLDSPLVFNDERRTPQEEDPESSSDEKEPDNVPEDDLEATEIAAYGVVLNNREQQRDIKLSQEDFTILVNGKLDNSLTNQKNSLSFDFYAPDEISDEMIRKASVKLPSGKKLTHKDNFVERNKKGKSYFTLTLEIKNKKSIPIEVDWGDGFVITYLLQIDLDKIS